MYGTFKESYRSNMNGVVDEGSINAEITEDHIDYSTTQNGKTEKGRIELYPNQYGFHGTPVNTYVMSPSPMSSSPMSSSPTKGYYNRKNHRKTKRR